MQSRANMLAGERFGQTGLATCLQMDGDGGRMILAKRE